MGTTTSYESSRPTPTTIRRDPLRFRDVSRRPSLFPAPGESRLIFLDIKSFGNQGRRGGIEENREPIDRGQLLVENFCRSLLRRSSFSILEIWITFLLFFSDKSRGFFHTPTTVVRNNSFQFVIGFRFILEGTGSFLKNRSLWNHVLIFYPSRWSCFDRY